MDSRRFVAIDVETANPWLGSICQIGIATFDGSQLVEATSILVDPGSEFDPINTRIHGISAADVAGAPRFSDAWRQSLRLIGDQPIASYGHFDRSAIAQACEAAGQEAPDNIWYNLHPVARRAWPEFAAKHGVSLARICDYLAIPLDNHHDAMADAVAAGLVFSAAITETGFNLSEWRHRLGQPIHPGSTRTKRIANSYTANPEGMLYGEGVVFTGALSVTRARASEMASLLGCTVLSGVSKKATLLVAGDQDVRIVGADGKSSKHLKAEDMIAKGHAIRILSESDFRRLARSAGIHN